MKHTKRLLFLSLFTLCLLGQSTAQIAANPKIDAIFSEWDSTDVPGCSLGVFQNGILIYGRGYGMANLEYDIPNSTQSVFRIGSTAKQFTAACIVLLAEAGKLKLQDPIRKYFPNLPAVDDDIKIQHLLNHTSGLRDYLVLSYLKGLRDDDFYTDGEVMQWLEAQESLNFEPGSQYLYCNSGFWLLGQLVEKVSGQNMADFAKAQIFDPLEMFNTHFHNDHTQIVKNRASGYVPKNGGGYRISMTTLDMIGDGGIFTTIEDVKKWDDAYYYRDVLSDYFWNTMTTKGILNNGEEIRYANGLNVGTYKGLKTIRHGGAFVGFRAELLRFPEQHTTIAVFANRGDANPSAKADQVAEVLLGSLMEKNKMEGADQQESEMPLELISLTAEQIKPFEGNYEFSPGYFAEVTLQRDTLFFLQKWDEGRYPIFPVSENTFVLGLSDPIRFVFSDLEGGEAQTLSFVQNGNTSPAKRTDGIVKTIKVDDFIGKYYSKEADVVYELYVVEDQLKLKIKGAERFSLVNSGEDKLSGGGMTFNFERENGTISGYKLDLGRVKNFHFKKQ